MATPHDALFRRTFASPEHAGPLLQAALPQFAFTPRDFATRTEPEVRALALSMQGLWTVACLQFLAAVGADEDAVVRVMFEWADVARAVLDSPSGHDAFLRIHSYILQVTKLDRRRLGVVIEQQFGTPTMKKFVSTYDQIRLEGKAEGRAEGKAEGFVEARATTLLRLLERRFGALSDSMIDRVAKASIDQLDCWVLRVLDVTAPEQIFDAE